VTPRASAARDLVALAKPGIVASNLLMVTAGLVVTPGTLSFGLGVATLLGAALVIAAANTFNMVLEREVDARMERTRWRPIAAGRLSAPVGWAIGCLLTALGATILGLVHPLTGALGVGALAIYAFVYTPLKRVTPWALAVGALPGATPPLLGASAVAPGDLGPGLALAVIVFLWQLPHFLAIAARRRRDYADAGIVALSVVRGEDVARRWARWTAVALVLAGLLPSLVGLAGPAQAGGAVLLGSVMVAATWGPRWARRTFRASLVYLPGLLVAVAVDRMMV